MKTKRKKTSSCLAEGLKSCLFHVVAGRRACFQTGRLLKLWLLVHCKWKSRQTAVLHVCVVQNRSVMLMNPWNKRIALRHCPLTLCCLPGGLPWKCATNTTLSKAQTSFSRSGFLNCSWANGWATQPEDAGESLNLVWYVAVLFLNSQLVKCFTDFITLITDEFSKSWLWVFNSGESRRILRLEMSARMLAISFTVIVSIIVQLVFILLLSSPTYSLQKLSPICGAITWSWSQCECVLVGVWVF